ncbi:MAG TPA: 50S ribosomal protein L6 [Anaerolineaceae bacterium]|jgi:large subunit ribosomal protein L6|nr:50S ribosomal protein L6 [Anaerolineales bacterium]HOG59323.1 50S ribosomal protein L6 [Anaerolineaceae bacterium]HOR84367.1 50S ribosomal protein L6 [Anaerolineaceae bacterium]HPL43318.1 50S ribosomal protein L6 [Anaerolineaceae bacterium]HPY32491.1 50S ribosomal protein L6 [Anaerolineaceae bacterium]
MSRIGKLPIAIPAGVEVKIEGNTVSVKGPLGHLEETFSPEIGIKLEDGHLIIERPNDEPRVRALHGTTRALLNNMVQGVSKGFERVLEVNGVGYRAELNGNDLVLNVGFSHPVKFPAPEGITFEVESKARLVKVKGRDRQQVGQVAANLREIRPPEHYKGTGIRYQGEFVKLKAGKAGKTGK